MIDFKKIKTLVPNFIIITCLSVPILIFGLQFLYYLQAKDLCKVANQMVAKAVHEKSQIDKRSIQLTFAHGLSPLFAHVADKPARKPIFPNHAVELAFEDIKHNLQVSLTLNKADSQGVSFGQTQKIQSVRIETMYAYEPIPLLVNPVLQLWGYYFSNDPNDMAVLRSGRIPIRNITIAKPRNLVAPTPPASPEDTQTKPEHQSEKSYI